MPYYDCLFQKIKIEGTIVERNLKPKVQLNIKKSKMVKGENS